MFSKRPELSGSHKMDAVGERNGEPLESIHLQCILYHEKIKVTIWMARQIFLIINGRLPQGAQSWSRSFSFENRKGRTNESTSSCNFCLTTFAIFSCFSSEQKMIDAYSLPRSAHWRFSMVGSWIEKKKRINSSKCDLGFDSSTKRTSTWPFRPEQTCW